MANAPPPPTRAPAATGMANALLPVATHEVLHHLAVDGLDSLIIRRLPAGRPRPGSHPADTIATSVPAPIAALTSARASAGAAIHAVTHHRHTMAAFLQLGDLGFLVFWEHFGEVLIDAQFLCKRRCDLLGDAGSEIMATFMPRACRVSTF
jgi:hypothetical protein